MKTENEIYLEQLQKDKEDLLIEINRCKYNYQKICEMSSTEIRHRYRDTGKREDYAKELELLDIQVQIDNLNKILQTFG